MGYLRPFMRSFLLTLLVALLLGDDVVDKAVMELRERKNITASLQKIRESFVVRGGARQNQDNPTYALAWEAVTAELGPDLSKVSGILPF